MTLQEKVRPFVIGQGAIQLLGRYAYTTALVAFREMVANALDQYVHTSAKDREKLVIITIDPLHRTITCEDNATGIENMEDFERICPADAECELGKVVGDEMSSYSKIHNEIIGVMHIGRLSYFNMMTHGEVKFYSNNGHNGHILPMIKNRGWGELDICDTTRALDHIGMKVVIPNVKDELLKPKKAIDMLSKWFGIRIARNSAKIVVKDTKAGTETIVSKPEDLKTDGEVRNDPILKLSKNRGEITCRLTEVVKPKPDNIDVYVKHVYIRSIHVDYQVEGWVNCNSLELDLSRDRFLQGMDSLYDEFEKRLEKYLITNNFKKLKSEEKKLREPRQLEDLLNISQELFSQMYKDSSLPLVGKQMGNGIKGNVSQEEQGKDKWERFNNVKIIEGTQDTNEPVILIGDDSDGRVKEPKPPVTIEEGGNSSAIKKTGISDKEKEGIIKPQIQIEVLAKGSMPTLYLESATTAVLNTDREVSEVILTSQRQKNKEVVLPYIVKAIINFNTREKGIPHEAWDEMYENTLNRVWNKTA